MDSVTGFLRIVDIAAFLIPEIPLGAVCELSIDRTGTDRGAAGWKAGSCAKVAMDPNRSWTAEIAVPWKALSGGEAAAGRTWGLNVCRNRRAAAKDVVEYTNRSVCGGGFHNPARFGRMTFR